MEIDSQLKKAIQICKDTATSRRRWGKHAGFGSYTADDVLDALVYIDESGLLTYSGEKEARIAANRRAGAAEARAIKYKNQLDNAKERIEELTVALEDEYHARAAYGASKVAELSDDAA